MGLEGKEVENLKKIARSYYDAHPCIDKEELPFEDFHKNLEEAVHSGSLSMRHMDDKEAESIVKTYIKSKISEGATELDPLELYIDGEIPLPNEQISRIIDKLGLKEVD